MYDELIERLRTHAKSYEDMFGKGESSVMMLEAADAIEELSAKVESLRFFADNISKLPDCNTCLKKDLCEFMPKYGEYCRINCPAWLGQPPNESE